MGANISKQERTGGENLNPQTFSSEGVEGYIPFTGPLEYVLKGFANGIKSGMSYSGAFTLKVYSTNNSATERESEVYRYFQLRLRGVQCPWNQAAVIGYKHVNKKSDIKCLSNGLRWGVPPFLSSAFRYLLPPPTAFFPITYSALQGFKSLMTLL